MPGPAPINTLLIVGTFEELSEELATYIDGLRKSQSESTGGSLAAEITPILKSDKPEQAKKVEVLKHIVVAASALNGAPEKEFVAAYNLLIHLISQAPDIAMFLPRVCKAISAPITSAPAHGTGLALSILGTIFNILQPDTELRYHVLLAIIKVIKDSAAVQSFESIKEQLKQLDGWFKLWDSDDEEQRALYLALVELANEVGDSDAAYDYLIEALRTIPTDEAATDESRELAKRALKASLTHPTHFDFKDLTALDAIQALRKSDPTHFELLEIFTSELLDDFNDFKDEHDGFIEKEDLDPAALNRKMRLLTLVSLAATASGAGAAAAALSQDETNGSSTTTGGGTRSLPYSRIAKALQIPAEDVEMWVIDVIRAGLVEGKLSQQNKTFLIHRATYRIFGESQWREVAARLDLWRSSLVNILDVVRQERENFVVQKEQEAKEMAGLLEGAASGGMGKSGGRGGRDGDRSGGRGRGRGRGGGGGRDGGGRDGEGRGGGRSYQTGGVGMGGERTDDMD